MDHIVRKLTRMAYDVQELRIATGLRVVAQFNDRFHKLKPTDTETVLATDEQAAVDRERDKLLKLITQSYERVTDGVAATARRKFYKFDDILTNETELWFVENYLDILRQEESAFQRLAKALKTFAFYNEFLTHVRGIGPAMAGVIISEFDPYRGKYPSSFWKYAGLDVVEVKDKETGVIKYEGRSRREAHLVQVNYTDKNGSPATRRGISYNPWLKSKLLAVLGPSFLRAGNERYTKVYADYKARMLQRPDLQDNVAIKAISHKRALRYMVKMFIIDLHMAWRAHEGLPVSVPYHEAKLGLTHGRDPVVEAIINKPRVFGTRDDLLSTMGIRRVEDSDLAVLDEDEPVTAPPMPKRRAKKAVPALLLPKEAQAALPLEEAPPKKTRARKAVAAKVLQDGLKDAHAGANTRPVRNRKGK
jgi:hypothetical protein